MAVVLLLGGTGVSRATLADYDAAIAADLPAGLTPVASLTNAVTLNGTNGAPFDFGASSGDVTMEFILQGDPVAIAASAYLAVGASPACNLRYEQINNTGQLGFTQLGVADYLFTPGVPSPARSAHVAYVWRPAELTMSVYINGTLAGTTTGVSDTFAMPTGLGTLGANAAGTEAMTGTIYRVTVYDEIESEAAMLRHAQAFKAEINPALNAYDAAIAADSVKPIASSTTAVVLPGTGGAPFDFGTTSGDVTMEFILEGDPVATATSGYLAVGENATSSLRYEQFSNTGRLGFTQGGVADYQFTPAVSSITFPSHLAYVWNATELSMKVYVNGALAGVVTNVSDAFVMPSGLGTLGANAAGTEAMVGTIYRVNVYAGTESPATILRHADAFTSVLRVPIIFSFTATPGEILGQGSVALQWETRNGTAVFLDNTDVTTLTNQAVSPLRTTSYRLVVSNSLAVATAKLTVTVNPLLTPYDTAIAADQTSGLTPVARLTDAVTLTGSGGAPFDFGATSGDVTMEFILEGDPEAIPASAYLAVGENATSNLRYEQNFNTGQLGFTQLGVADYLFTPRLPAPVSPTHLAYLWNAADLSLKVYVNGVLGGSVTGVSDAFGMPTGVGKLGANPDGAEAMVGKIYRVVVYGQAVPEATLLRHANAFTSTVRPAIISSFTATPNEIQGQGSAVLRWEAQNATAMFVNDLNVTSLTNLTVSPQVTTTYTLTASNAIAGTTAKVTVLVTPVLTAYDAAIAADAASGLAPVASLTSPVTLTGAGGAPFDFGATSGDVTMEFILEGDTVATAASGYLAVGEIPQSNLRYEQINNTGQLGFTQLGVLDYYFTPAVPSPTRPTQVTFVWNATELSMRVYVNGSLGGTAVNVSDAFAMPSGLGTLGANATGGEVMVGRIFRLEVYTGILPEATILRHAQAFVSTSRGPSLSVKLAAGSAAITLAEGVAGSHYRVEYRDSLSLADSWQLLQDVPTLSGTTTTVTDSTLVSARTQRFYRAVLVP